MSKTQYKILGEDFYINNRLTYSEIPESDSKVHGLLFNGRWIQGIFNDINPDNMNKYDRFGKKFDCDQNTDDLIRNLPQWYEKGIRAITVGLQGGGPIFTYSDWTVIDTGCFSKDGKDMSDQHKKNLLKIIKACDELGILVIVSILYQAQEHLFRDGVAIVQGVRTACEFLANTCYDNIIIEVANEHNVGNFSKHPMIGTSEGIANLINLAREWSNGRFAVGSSPGGGDFDKIIGDNSDVILIHGNTLRRQEYYDFICKIKSVCPNKPIVCNEDSQMFSQLAVSYATHTSWGYYNNFTKQEPPTDWSITKGEDYFFSKRLEMLILAKPEIENEFYLQGFEENCDIDGRYYVKLASLYPEKINYVEFYEDEHLIYTAFDEPFMLYSLTTWIQNPYIPTNGAEVFKAIVFLHDGRKLEITTEIER